MKLQGVDTQLKKELSQFLMLQQQRFYTECKSLNNFERGPSKEHSCEVTLKLVKWNGRSCHL